MNILKAAAVAVFAVIALPTVAFADDFEAQCTIADKSEQNVKSCKCASAKLTGADRTAALEAMKAVNGAILAGKTAEASAATEKHAKGLEILMTAQMSCM